MTSDGGGLAGVLGGGLFVQFSSIGGRVGGSPGIASYQAAKLAVDGFTRVLAAEAAPFAIRTMVVDGACLLSPATQPGRHVGTGQPLSRLHRTLPSYLSNRPGGFQRRAGLSVRPGSSGRAERSTDSDALSTRQPTRRGGSMIER